MRQAGQFISHNSKLSSWHSTRTQGEAVPIIMITFCVRVVDTHIHLHTYVYTHLHIYTPTHPRIHKKDTYLCIFNKPADDNIGVVMHCRRWMDALMYVYNIYIIIYTYTYTYTYTYIHIYVYIFCIYNIYIGWFLEKNYDGRGQRTPKSRTTEEAMGRHDTTRHEVSPIKEGRYWWQKEVEQKDLSGWPLPWKGLIQAQRRYSNEWLVAGWSTQLRRWWGWVCGFW